MPDNNIYGVDFIARCMAGEALDKAGQNAWTLVAGNNISILSDEEQKTETISATYEVDSALSTTSENPVQNKVITNALATKPTSVLPDGTVISNQKIMALTRAQYNAIQNKDPNTYYMVTDDPVPSPINVRTAYVDQTSNIQNTTLDGMTAFQIPVPADFTALDVSFNFSGRATSGEWTLGCDNYVHTFKVLPTDTRIRSSLQATMIEGHTAIGNADLRMMGDVSTIRYYAQYDSTNNTVTIAISVPFLTQADATTVTDNTTNAEWTTLTMNKIGYVAYGPNNVVISDAFVAGQGITIDGTTIGLTDAPAADVNATISNGDLTIQIEDANGVPMGTGATVTLPTGATQVQADWNQSDSSAVDYIKNKPDLSSYETSAHAAATYQTIAGMSGYATTNDLSDRTYYCTCDTASSTSAKVVTTTQDFKLEKGAIIAVKFDNQNGASYVTLNVNNTGAKSIAVGATTPYTGDKPDRCGYGSGYLNYYIYTGTYWHAMGCSRSVNEVPLTNVSQNGRVLTNVNGNAQWEPVPTPADMATQTWVGQQGYLTSADEVPTVGSSDDGKVLTASYSGGTGSYAWATPAAGGLQVETDGTNYWITVNGIRLYFASSAPTGTIPDGSVGIGW